MGTDECVPERILRSGHTRPSPLQEDPDRFIAAKLLSGGARALATIQRERTRFVLGGGVGFVAKAGDQDVEFVLVLVGEDGECSGQSVLGAVPPIFRQGFSQRIPPKYISERSQENGPRATWGPPHGER